MMKIHLINQQKIYPLKLQKIKALTEFLSVYINTRNKSWTDISVIITNHKEITKLNKKYLNKNNSTDVISFTYEPIPGEKNNYSGDIIVNIEQAMEEGSKRGNIDYEFAFYIAHGLDHLSGHNDDTFLKRYIMHSREKKWLKKAQRKKLLTNLIS